MKSFLTTFLIVLLSIKANSQTYVAQFKVDRNGWGYIDNKGKEIITPQYPRCTPFSKDGLALFENPRKNIFGFINIKGETLATIPDKYQLISFMGYGITAFNDGLLAVNTKKNDNWGFMDQTGKYIIEPQFDKVTAFNGGYAAALDGKLWYILNKSGKLNLIEDETVRSVKKFSEGLAPFLTSDGDLYGFLDTTGKEAIAPEYASVGDFCGGLAWVKLPDLKVGYIDKTGKIVVEAKYYVGNDFDPESGIARVKKDGKWGYISTTEYLGDLNTGANTYREFRNGLCLARKDDKFGFFNNKGEWVIKPQFEAGRDFKNGYAAVRQNGFWGFIDKSGNWVIKPTMAGVKDFELVE